MDDEQEPLLPVLTPRRVLGEEYKPNEYGASSPTPVGFFGSIGIGAGTAAIDVAQRWQAIDGSWDDYPTQEERQEIIGDRPLVPPLNLSADQLRRRVAMYDREQYISKYDTNLLGEIVGSMPVLMGDPVNIATMPLGGANFARAAGAATWGGFLRQSAIGGAKAGLAGVPVDVATQQMARGEVDPASVVMGAAVPVVASPLMGVPTFALRALQGRRASRTVNAHQAEEVGRNPLYPEGVTPQTMKAAEAELDSIPPPPQMPAAPDLPPPTARIDAAFEGYEGGAPRWVQELAAGREPAREYAQRLGVDPEAPALRAMLADVKAATATTMQRTPAGIRQLSEDVIRSVAGEQEPLAQRRMQQAGLMDAEGRIPDLIREELDNADNRAVLRRDGPEAVWIRATNRVTKALTAAKQDLEQAVERVDAELTDWSVSPQFRAGRIRQRKARAKRDIQKLETNLQQLMQLNRTAAPERVDLHRLAMALDAARIEGGDAAPSFVEPAPRFSQSVDSALEPPPAPRGEQQVQQDMEQWASKFVDTADLENPPTMGRVLERMKACVQ